MTKPRLRDANFLRCVASALVIAAIVLVGARFAWCTLFTNFEWYDDEGHFLVSIAGCNGGRALYDEVFSQHGPLLYVLSSFVYAKGLVPLDHEHVRLLVEIAWLATVVLVGVTVHRLTRNVALVAATSAILLLELVELVHEPGHPQGLVLPLLAVAAAAPAFLAPTRPRLLAFLAGAVGACLFFTKVNVGVFALLGLAIAFVHFGPRGAFASLARWFLALSALALPGVLMRSHFGDAWARDYGISASLAILGVLLVLCRSSTAPRFDGSVFARFVVGGLVAGALICGLTLAHGSSASGLLDGVLLQNLRFAHDAYSPRATGSPFLGWAVASPLVFVAQRLLSRGGRAARTGAEILLVAVKVAFAVAVLYDATTTHHATLLLRDAPWMWAAVLPLAALQREDEARPDPREIGRVFLVALAMLQLLQAYPVAGTQVTWSTFLLLPVAALCLSDVVERARTLVGSKLTGDVAVPTTTWTIAGWIASLAVVALGLARVGDAARIAGLHHRGSTPLALPGTGDLRLSEREVAQYRWLAANARAADAFYAWPGMNSLWLWTGKTPPTPRNATYWTDVLTPADQRDVIAALEKIPRTLAIERLPEYVLAPDAISESAVPLGLFLRKRFKRVASVGDYAIAAREGWSPEPTYCAHAVEEMFVVSAPALGDRSATRVEIVDLESHLTLASTDGAGEKALLICDESGKLIPFQGPGAREELAGRIDLARSSRFVLVIASAATVDRVRTSAFPVARLIDAQGAIVASIPFAR